jgi:hypothetical protein
MFFHNSLKNLGVSKEAVKTVFGIACAFLFLSFLEWFQFGSGMAFLNLLAILLASLAVQFLLLKKFPEQIRKTKPKPFGLIFTEQSLFSKFCSTSGQFFEQILGSIIAFWKNSCTQEERITLCLLIAALWPLFLLPMASLILIEIFVLLLDMAWTGLNLVSLINEWLAFLLAMSFTATVCQFFTDFNQDLRLEVSFVVGVAVGFLVYFMRRRRVTKSSNANAPYSAS